MTNLLCKIETGICVVAIALGIFCSELSALCWLTFMIAILIHILTDKNYWKSGANGFGNNKKAR